MSGNQASSLKSENKIIHVDMDAFYASIEQNDDPSLRGKPIAVGGNKERGVVAAASYEARKYGVKSAMPSVTAARLCPELIFVKPRFGRYKEIAMRIRDVFYGYTDLVEPLSLDEAYLDVTVTKKGLPSATIIAQSIKDEIKEKTGLVASAGISYNKFLAKIASDMDKPDGLFVILPDDAFDFLSRLPIKKFFGIGKITAEKMQKIGIFTGSDLRRYTEQDLLHRFGKVGAYYYHICRGVDLRSVNPARERKSLSAETTLEKEIMNMQALNETLRKVKDEVWKRYTSQSKRGKTITLKIKFGNFTQITRSQSVLDAITSEEEFINLANQLISKDLIREEGIRLVGLGVSNFKAPTLEPLQLTLGF
ncbi:MAG: DNA polymerase-4 [Cyclobacteriaceae bacterium]|jgi:DNA polymerase-4